MTELLVGATCLSSDPGDDRWWRGVVPDVPASRLDPVAEDVAILLWVKHGTLTVNVEHHSVLVATTGQAVWLPPGTRHAARLEPGSVALPIMADADDLPDAVGRPCVIVVPSSWSDWLVHRLARWFGFTSGAEVDRSRLRDLLGGVAPVEQESDPPRLPPMPRSPGPRAVVDLLVRDPSCSASLSELAAEAMTSPRTLQRQLREETGSSLARWRSAIRIAAAAVHLDHGRDIGWTAHHVGYASVSGFTHAFGDLVGVSPGRYAARGVRRADTARPAPPELAFLLVDEALPADPPTVPAVPPASWVTPFDSVLWVYRGTATIGLGGSRRVLAAGDVIWLSRGLVHLLEVSEGSIVLPLGWKPGGRPVRADSLQVVRMGQDDRVETFLLHTVVANHFLLRPPGHDEQAFLDLLGTTNSVPEELPTALSTIVSALIADPGDRRSLAVWSAELDVDPVTLGRDFSTFLGEPFVRWRATARMSQARALMAEGRRPSYVARRLGYAHLSAFSKAFSAAHGMPPSEWWRREAGPRSR